MIKAFSDLHYRFHLELVLLFIQRLDEQEMLVAAIKNHHADSFPLAW
ncbi:hypothetical protein [Sphaerochaeta halotolerans]|nr:hypothetical protein [Sphaerochaeta halotolerans]MBG0766634.1 hypothetical protein [Spirochaetaceae bacterium]MXI85561.1 hypothetical protein [Sphaerochaeta halotolerans]